MADLQVTISATGAAELSTLFSSLEKVSTAATKLAGSGKALEELRKLMVGLGNSGSSLGGLNNAVKDLIASVRALPTQLSTVLQNVPQQMQRSGQAAGRALGEGVAEGVTGSLTKSKSAVRAAVAELQLAYETAVNAGVTFSNENLQRLRTKGVSLFPTDREILADSKRMQATMVAASREQVQLAVALRAAQIRESEGMLLGMRELYSGMERSSAQLAGVWSKLGSLATGDSGLRLLRSTLHNDSQLILGEMQQFYQGLEAADARLARALSKFGSLATKDNGLRLLRSSLHEDSQLILSEMRQFYQGLETSEAQLARVLNKLGTLATKDNGLRLLRSTLHNDSQLILGEMRQFYVQLEAEQAKVAGVANLKAAIRSRLAGAAVSDRVPGTTPTSQETLGAMREYYLSRGATMNGGPTQSGGGLGAIDPAKADKGTNALLRQKAAIDAYIPTANTGHSAARGLASGFGLLWLTWGNLLPLLTTAAASNGFVAMAKSGAEVQHTLTMIGALSGATMTEVAGLNDQMHSLAKNGIFGPSAVAEALKVLTQAGLSAKEASANLGATLNFSVAGMVPIQQAAETLVTVTTAFNMGAAGFSVAGDVIAKTAAISKTSVEGMSGAFKTASVLNAQYGVTLTDVGVGLAALANLGIEASAAGTALRNMYADLSGRSSKVSQILKEQGLQLRDLSTGKFPDVIKVVRDLNEVLSKKTPTGAQNLLQSLVGERGGKPLVEMLELFRKAPKDLSAGFSNALEEMQGEVRNAFGTAAQVAIAANTSVKNQYASLIASFQSDLVRVFEENEPRMLSAISSIKKSLMDGGELQAVLSFFLGIMSRIVQVVAENAKVFGFALAAWAASRTVLAALSLTSAKLAIDTAAVSAAQATQVATTAAVGTAATVAAGPLALLGKLLSGINIVIGVGAALWAAYQFAKASAQNAKETAGQYSFDETLKGLQKENETLEKELVLLRQGKTEAEAQKALAIADVYQKAADGMAQKRKGLEDELARMQPQRVGNAEGVVTPLMAAQIKLKKEQIALARKDEASALQALTDQQAKHRALSAAKAELIEMNSRRTPLGSPDGVDFDIGKPGKPGGSFDQFANYTADLLRIQKDGHTKRMADLQQQTAFEKQLLDAKHRAALVSDADFQAQSLAQTIADEQRRLAEIERFRVSASKDLSDKMESVKRDAGKTDLSEASKLEGKAYSDLSPQIQNLVGHYKKLVDAKEALDTQVDTDVSKVNREIAQRRLLNDVDLSGRLQAEKQAYTDLARGMTANVEAQAARLRTEEQASTMSESVLAGLKARQDFEQETAPQLAKRVEELQKWRAEEEALAATLNGMQATGEDQGAMAQGLADRYNTVRAAVTFLTAELARLRDLQGQGASAAQITAEVAQARKETLKMRDDLSEGLTKAILSGEKDFKKHWQSLREWLKDLFGKTVLTPVFKQMTGSAMSSIGSFLTGGGGQSGAPGGPSGFSNMASAAGLGGSLGAFGSFAATGFMNTVAGTGMMSGLGAANAIGLGTASGAGMAVGAVAPYVLAAVAIVSALDKKATPHVGGYALADASGNITDITKQQGGNQQKETQTAVGQLAKSLASSFNSVAETFGKDAGYSIRAVFESDANDASWGLFHLLKDNVKQQGSFDALGTLASDPGEGLKEFSAKAALAVRDALVLLDIPDWARKTLKDLGDAVDVDALTQAAAKIAEVQVAFQSFLTTLKVYGPAFSSVASLSVNALDGLAQLAGGLDQLGTSLATYYEKFYSAEERRANTISYLTEEFNKLGVMPTSMKAFREVMDQAQQGLATDEGRAKFNTLLKLSGDFASLFDETAGGLSKVLAELAKERSSIEVDLLRAQGNKAEADRVERLTELADLTAGLVESEKAAVAAAYDLNASLREQVAAMEHASEVNRAVADLQNEGRGISADLLAAKGDSPGAASARRLLDLETLTQGMTELEAQRIAAAYDYNAALRTEVAMMQQVQEVLNNLAKEGSSLQADLLDAQGQEQAAASLRRQNDLAEATRGMAEVEAERVRAAYDYNAALRADIEALRQAAAHAKEVRSTLEGMLLEGGRLSADLLSAQGDSAGAGALRRALDLAKATEGMSAEEAALVTAVYDANVALRAQVSAQEEIAASAREARTAWQALAKTILAEVVRLRQESQTGDQGYAARQAAFATLTAQARSGNIEAGQQLVGAGSDLLDAAKESARTGFEYRLQEASVATSLETTAKLISAKWGSAASEAASRERALKLASEQLAAAKSSMTLLGNIDGGITTVAGLIAAMTTILSQLPQAKPSVVPPPPVVAPPPPPVVAPPPPPVVAPPPPPVVAPPPPLVPSTITGSPNGPVGPTKTDAWQKDGANDVWVSTNGAVGTRPSGSDDLSALVIQGKKSKFTAAQAVAWIKEMGALGKLRAVYDAAKDEGMTLASVDALMGWPAKTAEDWAKSQGLPTFANGGDHFGGLRVVGEFGPELEATGPARIHSSESLSRMLRSAPEGVPRESRGPYANRSDGAASAEEIRALREDQRRQAAASVSLHLRMTKLLERWEMDGLPETRPAT